MNPRSTAAIPGRHPADKGENTKYSLQRIKKVFILYHIDMEVTAMDSLCFSDENDIQCHLNRTTFAVTYPTGCYPRHGVRGGILGRASLVNHPV